LSSGSKTRRKSSTTNIQSKAWLFKTQWRPALISLDTAASHTTTLFQHSSHVHPAVDSASTTLSSYVFNTRKSSTLRVRCSATSPRSLGYLALQCTGVSPLPTNPSFSLARALSRVFCVCCTCMYVSCLICCADPPGPISFSCSLWLCSLNVCWWHCVCWACCWSCCCVRCCKGPIEHWCYALIVTFCCSCILFLFAAFKLSCNQIHLHR